MKSANLLSTASIRHLILADHRELLRDGLSQLIYIIEEVTMAAQVGKGVDCLRIANDIHPAIVVCCSQLPDISGIDLTRQLRALHPAPHIVLVGSQESHDWVSQAVQAGVCGVVMQRENAHELIAAIRAALDGCLYLSPLANSLFTSPGKSNSQLALTPRQREIMLWYADGQSTKQIAYRLGLSIKTVATHREQILRRLTLRNTAELIRYAIREGVIDA